ncbi:MAG: hypothetical protein M1165_00190 [Candidatus Pacearchaeota archaeon]|nr:hypothetical protein [Candidatus Pacearchaeota archaeon]
MRNYSLTSQERSDYCVCSVVQAIFRVHKINLSQDEIARNLTRSGDGFRVDDGIFSEFMKTNGFEYHHFVYNETPFNEPDTLLNEMNEHGGIVGIREPGQIYPHILRNHVYLLQNFEDPLLMLINPKNNGLVVKDIYTLRREMARMEVGFFGLFREYIER